MRRPVSNGVLYAPKVIDVLEATETKETGNDKKQ
jgi:hypothetical protein